MSKKTPSNINNTNNYIQKAKEYVPDSEDAGISDIEIVQKPKKAQKKLKQKKSHSVKSGSDCRKTYPAPSDEGAARSMIHREINVKCRGEITRR